VRRSLLAPLALAVGCAGGAAVRSLAPVPATAAPSAATAGSAAAPAPAACPSIEVRFEPNTDGPGCTELVVALIDGARSSIRMRAYGFSHHGIIAALRRARGRGVAVEILLDKSNHGNRGAEELTAAGAVVLIDRAHAIAHAKELIVDGEAVEAGSFNYTESADRRNAEGCIAVRDRAVAAAYAAEWARHRAHAEP
jgi:phosphatidylserine/phosphatidylglycerophosphate/cardiolipin synthase-like enzyme